MFTPSGINWQYFTYAVVNEKTPMNALILVKQIESLEQAEAIDHQEAKAVLDWVSRRICMDVRVLANPH